MIIGILFALAAPNYSAWIQNQQIRAATEAVLNGIQLARNQAVANNAPARFVMCNLPYTSWQVLASVSSVSAASAPVADAVCAAGTTGEIRVQERYGLGSTTSAQASAVGAASAAANTVTFNSFGRVVANADTSVSITQVDITTPKGTRPLRVTVSSGGNSKMCDPSVLLAANDPRHC